MIELLPYVLLGIFLCISLLVECHNVDNCLWILFLLLLRYAAVV